LKTPWPLIRGRVYAVKVAPVEGEKYFLVVSNNRRNGQLPQALGVRLTTSLKPVMPSIVELPPGEVFIGRALCDDIVELYQDEIIRDLGALAPRSMDQINRGLKAALDIP
jgi:mRNA interferase MazF